LLVTYETDTYVQQNYKATYSWLLQPAATAAILLELFSNVSFVAGWCPAAQQQAHPNTPNKYINKYALLQYRDENSKV